MNLLDYLPVPFLSLTISKIENTMKVSGLNTSTTYLKNILLEEIRFNHVLDEGYWIFVYEPDDYSDILTPIVFNYDYDLSYELNKKFENLNTSSLVKFSSKGLYMQVYFISDSELFILYTHKITYRNIDEIYNLGWVKIDFNTLDDNIQRNFYDIYPNIEEQLIMYNSEKEYYAIVNKLDSNKIDKSIFDRLYSEINRNDDYIPEY